MTEATEAQIKLAQKLNIDNPGQYTKEALSLKISEKLPDRSKKPAEAPQSTITAKHDVVITRTEKPHSFEFGKASKRHKIYYGTVAELKEHIDMLKEQGLADIEDIYPATLENGE